MTNESNQGHVFAHNDITDEKLRQGTEKALIAFTDRKTLAEIGYVPDPLYGQYEAYVAHVYSQGTVKTDRTGEGTVSVFGYQMRYDLSKGFPLVTTKKGIREGGHSGAHLVPPW
jgi:hypothetical protein